MRHHIVFVLSTLLLSACTTSSYVLLGQARTPLSAADVRLYLEPLSGHYETIAIVAATSRRSLAWTAEGKAEVVMERLKSEAAKLGANGILLEEISDGPPGSIGAGVAPDMTRDHTSIGVGFNAAGLTASRSGRALAIHTDPAGTGSPGQ